MRLPVALVPVVAGTLLGACRPDRVPNGTWGGDHVSLTVGDDGGRVEFDCAHGSVDRPIMLDDEGRFSTVGTFVPEHGPRLADESAQSRPARYAGRLEKGKVTFTVTVEGEDGRGPFTASLARAPKLRKCR